MLWNCIERNEKRNTKLGPKMLYLNNVLELELISMTAKPYLDVGVNQLNEIKLIALQINQQLVTRP